MSPKRLNIVIIGLSITSSWGNGHATTFRSLVRELNKRGHQVTFLERDVPWYAEHRDLVNPPFCRAILYNNLEELKSTYRELVKYASMVIVGSYVPEGVAVGEFVTSTATGVTAFYDIDTPVTLAKLEKQDYEYLHPMLIPRYDMYLSFTGGPILNRLEQELGSPMARPFYCAVDTELYYPTGDNQTWDLGYLGTYSADRQPPLQELMVEPANSLPWLRFVVAGAQYPEDINWPHNLAYVEHLPPALHREFYNSQRFTLNITRADMRKAGYSPSVRLFEAAACGTTIISDYWEGIDEFFDLGSEILIASCAKDAIHYLTRINETERISIGLRAQQKVLNYHTSSHRVSELENYYATAVLKKNQTRIAS